MALLYGRAGRLASKNGGFRPGQRLDKLHSELFRMMIRGIGGEVDESGALYDAFGVFGAVFRELVWKTPIFSCTAVPATPNAS